MEAIEITYKRDDGRECTMWMNKLEYERINVYEKARRGLILTEKETKIMDEWRHEQVMETVSKFKKEEDESGDYTYHGGLS